MRALVCHLCLVQDTGKVIIEQRPLRKAFFLQNSAERSVELSKPLRSRSILLALAKETYVVVHVYKET